MLVFVVKIDERYPSDPIGASMLIPCYDFGCSRDPFDITWCLTIWHPTELIEVCRNASWNYSTPIAAELGILDNLEVVENCKFFFHGCLKVVSIEPYYNEAYFTCHVQTESCSKETFHSLTVTGKTSTYIVLTHSFLSIIAPTTTLPKLIEHPDSPQYLEYGENVVLKCVYSSISTNYFTSWTNSTNVTLHVIEEDPFCIPEPNVSNVIIMSLIYLYCRYHHVMNIWQLERENLIESEYTGHMRPQSVLVKRI